MQTVKKMLMMSALVLAVLLCAITGVLAASGGEAGASLVVGVPADRCPVFYPDLENGGFTGIGVDLMRAAAETAGYSVTFVNTKEKTLKDALDSEEYDLIMPLGSAISSTSGAPSIVTSNLIQTPFTLVTTSREEVLPELNHLKVGMLSSLGGAAETVRELYPGIEISMYETMSDSVKALRRGEVDALLHNSYVWSYVLQKPSYSDLKVQPSAMFSMDFRAGTLDTPEGRELVREINRGIAAISETRRQAIVLDHTSRRLYRYDLSDYLFEYGLILLLGILLIAALAVIAVQKVHALRREQEETLRQLIDQDPLTGCLSLNGFRKRVKELLQAHPDAPYLICYSNIKNFKFVNDSLGMNSGDELLQFWVSRYRSVLSANEALGRIGPDHFAVLRLIEGDDKLFQDEKHVIDPVRNYYIDRGLDKRLQICTGVYVLTPADYQQPDVDHMLDYARVAEKKVRNTYKDGYELYNPNQWERGKQLADVVGHLSMALQSGELQVWYQPQVDFGTGQIIGTEALCRWNHPILGWLRPGEFIPILEEAGLIYELDSHVWELVCRDLKRWNEQGFHRSVSVNLSRCDIREDFDICGHFCELIRTYGLTADQLRIEITETAFVEDPDLLIRTTVSLREAGFQVEMDDFGSGYSSLHMLKEVPVDRIKLDLHFLTGTGDPEKGRIIVTQIIQMIQSLGMGLIAEGVENASQARFLLSRGCPEMQGFYFYKPMSVKELEALYENGGM